MTNIQELVGKTYYAVRNLNNEELTFESNDGSKFKFLHNQNCCETVEIVDVIGDLQDLVGSPLLVAEMVQHVGENPPGVTPPECQDSFTWTFYKFATIKGSVTVRWYGGSNGYYSEEVNLEKF